MVVAHCPVDGVKVYVVTAVSIIAGNHVPVIPLVEVFGNDVPGQAEETVNIGTDCVPFTSQEQDVVLKVAVW